VRASAPDEVSKVEGVTVPRQSSVALPSAASSVSRGSVRSGAAPFWPTAPAVKATHAIVTMSDVRFMRTSLASTAPGARGRDSSRYRQLSFGTLPVAGITESRAAEGHTATAGVSLLSIATRDGGIGAHGATPVSPCGKIR
jgi:hypothetical protein